MVVAVSHGDMLFLKSCRIDTQVTSTFFSLTMRCRFEVSATLVLTVLVPDTSPCPANPGAAILVAVRCSGMLGSVYGRSSYRRLKWYCPLKRHFLKVVLLQAWIAQDGFKDISAQNV